MRVNIETDHIAEQVRNVYDMHDDHVGPEYYGGIADMAFGLADYFMANFPVFTQEQHDTFIRLCGYEPVR